MLPYVRAVQHVEWYSTVEQGPVMIARYIRLNSRPYQILPSTVHFMLTMMYS